MRELLLDEIFYQVSLPKFKDKSEKFWEEVFSLDYQPTIKIINFFYENICGFVSFKEKSVALIARHLSN